MSDCSDIDDSETIHTVSDMSEDTDIPTHSDDEFIDNTDYDELEQKELYFVMKQIYDILIEYIKN